MWLFACAAEEAALRARLARLRGELGGGGGALARRCDALRGAAAQRAAPAPHGAPAPGAPQLEAASLAKLTAVLSAQSDALKTLADVIKRDLRDVAIMAREEEANGDAMRA